MKEAKPAFLLVAPDTPCGSKGYHGLKFWFQASKQLKQSSQGRKNAVNAITQVWTHVKTAGKGLENGAHLKAYEANRWELLEMK
jgi:hypothetical protein